MKRDNEKIIEVLAGAQHEVREALVKAAIAGASATSLRFMLETLQSLENAGNEMGDRNVQMGTGARLVNHNVPGVIEHVAIEAIAPLEHRLQTLIERVDRLSPPASVAIPSKAEDGNG